MIAEERKQDWNLDDHPSKNLKILWHSVSPHIKCYSEDTEVLTREGWKLIKDVDRDDEVLTLNTETFKLEYQKPLEFQSYEYDGEVIHIQSRYIDLIVNPDHNIFIAKRQKDNTWKWRFEKAKDNINKVYKVPKTGEWEGEIPTEFKIHDKIGKLREEQYFKFVIYYLLYGSLGKLIEHDLSTQNEDPEFREVVVFHNSLYDYCNKAPRRKTTEDMYNVMLYGTPVAQFSEDTVYTLDPELFKFVSENFYKGTPSKRIPDSIKSLPPVDLQLFLSLYYDIYGRNIPYNAIYVAGEEELAGDLQEIAIKAGYASDVIQKDENLWIVTVNKRAKFHMVHKKIMDEVIHYRGHLVCLSVPNRTLMVRRNGKAVISGNSGYGIVTRNIAGRLRELGINVTVSAYYGLEPGGVMVIDGIPCLPCIRKPGEFGRESYISHYRKFGCNVGILHSDFWVFNWFPEIGYSIMYSPMDHEDYAINSVELMKKYKKIVSFLPFQQKEVKKLTGRDTPIIEHGVSPVYKPVDKSEARKMFRLSEDAFVMGMVAANSDKEGRKGFSELFNALELAFDEDPNFKRDLVLFLHTDADSDKGLPLKILAYKHGLYDKCIFQDKHLFTIGLPDDEMAMMYNAFDVHVLPSKREGFGLPILEAMACGVPTIGHRFSSFPDLIGENEERGWLAKSALKIDTPIGGTSAIVDIYDLKDKILDAYHHPDKIKEKGERGIEFAKTLEWDNVVLDKWIPFLDQVAEEQEEEGEVKEVVI